MEEKKKPILLNTDMVQAVKSGRKTVTRRPQGKKKPYDVGDVLWVRETWQKVEQGFIYKAEEPNLITKWKPSIFMPREAERITLKVLGVHQGSIKEMSEQDAMNEGFQCLDDFKETFFRLYPNLDDETILWAIEFEVLRCT